jgi:hypothetical protein
MIQSLKDELCYDNSGVSDHRAARSAVCEVLDVGGLSHGCISSASLGCVACVGGALQWPDAPCKKQPCRLSSNIHSYENNSEHEHAINPVLRY